MSGCDEWTSLLSVFRLHCDMVAICRHLGILNNLDPGAELPTAYHELIPLCLTDSAPSHPTISGRTCDSTIFSGRKTISCIEDIYGSVFSHQRSGFGEERQPCHRRHVGLECNGTRLPPIRRVSCS